jgi:hypothetical protein
MSKELENSILEDAKNISSGSEQSTEDLISQEQQQAINEEIALEEKYGDSDLLAGAAGAARGLSLGLSDIALKETGIATEQDLRELDERNEAASTIGEIGGVIGGTLASGGSSLGAKVASSGINAATKAGLATEHLVGSALKKVVKDQGKQSLARKILQKSVEKGAGLTVEGTFYSTGHLLSENALGRADINAENVLASAKDAATLGILMGTGAGTFSAVVPKVKNGKITGWATEKFKGKPPIDMNETAAKALGLTDKEISKLRNRNPSEYNNLVRHVTEDLKMDLKDSAKTLFKKNEKLIKDSAQELDALYPELDSVLQAGDDLGAAFDGTSNAEVSSSIVRSLDNWIDETVTMTNPNGQTVLRPGITESELKNVINEVEKIKDIFGTKQASDAVSKIKEIELKYKHNLAKKNLEINRIQQNMKKAKEFKDIPSLKSKVEKLKLDKKANSKKVSDRITALDRQLLEQRQVLQQAKEVATKAKAKAKVTSLQNKKAELRLNLKEANSQLDDKITQFNVKIKQAPKIKAPEFFEDQLKLAKAELKELTKNRNTAIKPLQKEVNLFTQSSSKAVDASKLRKMRQDWSNKAEWSKPSSEISVRARLARKGYELLNSKIDDLAAAVEGTNSNIANKIRVANLKSSTGLKLQNSLERVSGKDLKIQEGAMKFLVGSIAKSTGLGGPIPFIMQSKAAYDVMRGLGESNLVHKMKLLSAVEKANKTVEKKVNSSIGKFFKESLPKVVKPASLNILMKSELAKEVDEETLAQRKPKDKKQAFKNISKNLAKMMSDPETMIDKASAIYGDFSDAAPETRGFIGQNVVNMVQYLHEKLPKDATLTPHSLTRREWNPSTIELAKFERVLKAVQDPLSVLDDLENGTITREAAEALRVLKPNLFQKIQEQVMDKIATSKEPIPYQKRLLLGILLDIESDAALNPANIAGLQEMYSEEQVSQLGGSTRVSKSKAANLDLAESEQTPVERAERR